MLAYSSQEGWCCEMANEVYSYTILVTFNANGGSGGPSFQSQSKTTSALPYNMSIQLKTEVPTRAGYVFLGWARNASATTAVYSAGGTFSHHFTSVSGSGAASYAVTLYAVWEADWIYVSFNANEGTGGPSYKSQLRGVSSALPDEVPTRTGYDFAGWCMYRDGSGTLYQAGAYFVSNSNVTLYAIWKEAGSYFTLSKTSLQMDNTDSCVVTITKTLQEIDHHTVKIKLNDQVITINNVGASTSFVVPLSWNAEVTDALAIAGIVSVTSYFSNNEQWGEEREQTILFTVPDSAAPSVSITMQQAGDQTAIGLGVYVQGYSSVRAIISAQGQYGASITGISITGAGLNESTSGASIDETSDVFAGFGLFTFVVNVTDSRGKVFTDTRTIEVLEYHKPALVGFTAYRSNNLGELDDIDGAYMTVKHTGVNIAASGYNQSTVSYKYTIYRQSSYTTITSNAQTNTDYIETADISKTYVVVARITDSFGQYTEVELRVDSVECSLALGLNNDRARFGGACRQAGLEVDWPARFNGRIYADDHFQRGYIPQTTVSANSEVVITKTFDKAFSIAPIVIATLNKNAAIGDVVLTVYGIDPTHFKLRFENLNASDVTVGATWVAII